jgi:hypothetical protein
MELPSGVVPPAAENTSYEVSLTESPDDWPTRYAVAAVPLPPGSVTAYACGGGPSCSEITVLNVLPSVSMRTRRGESTSKRKTASAPTGFTPQATALSS